MSGIVAANDGMTLRYGTPETPAPNAVRVPGGRVTFLVSVEPANPANAVTVNYSVNGGSVRSFRAIPEGSAWRPGPQYFRVRFPKLPRGAEVRYGIVARRAGRSVPAPGTTRRLPYAFTYEGAREEVRVRRAETQPVAEGEHHAPFKLEFLCHTETQLRSEPEIIGQTPDGSIHVHYFVRSGTLRGPRLNGSITRQGGDWMTIRPDGVGVPNVRATIVTDDGALIHMRYTGAFELGKDGYSAFLRQKLPTRPKLLIAPQFLTASKKYAWINRCQCVGVGYVETSSLVVHYDLYALH